MKSSELDYELPPERIAQQPSEQREESRLLVVDRATRSLREDIFRNIAGYLQGGDCLVINDTKVIRARLHGKKATGARVEIFLLHELLPGEWCALVRPSARVAPGAFIDIGERARVRAEVLEVLPEGRRRVRFDHPDVLHILEELGEVPLPPYIHRQHAEAVDSVRYQTVYAHHPGAVAAPTAGLHYTEQVLESLRQANIHIAALTLHVGYGTFKPIQVENVEEHIVEPEDFAMPEETAQLLNQTRAAGGRIVAVGTTATRVLETQFRDRSFHAGSGVTDKYIYPGYEFGAVDILQTNFHLPKSSLLALVCAFAGRDLVMEAYRYAVRERFRFYSYGDTMLIL
jgi:S-adenosylmethionine:tRNA ribosyltransferase-isomerase